MIGEKLTTDQKIEILKLALRHAENQRKNMVADVYKEFVKLILDDTEKINHTP